MTLIPRFFEKKMTLKIVSFFFMEKLFRQLAEKLLNSRYPTYELDDNGNETTDYEETYYTGGDPQYSGVLASFMTFLKEGENLRCQEADVYRQILG